jgi:hypothetical protein
MIFFLLIVFTITMLLFALISLVEGKLVIKATSEPEFTLEELLSR